MPEQIIRETPVRNAFVNFTDGITRVRVIMKTLPTLHCMAAAVDLFRTRALD